MGAVLWGGGTSLRLSVTAVIPRREGALLRCDTSQLVSGTNHLK
jgi:hypothetical protein